MSYRTNYYGWDPPETTEPGECCNCSDCSNCDYYYDFWSLDETDPDYEDLDPDGFCRIGCTPLSEPEYECD